MKGRRRQRSQAQLLVEAKGDGEVGVSPAEVATVSTEERSVRSDVRLVLRDAVGSEHGECFVISRRRLQYAAQSVEDRGPLEDGKCPVRAIEQFKLDGTFVMKHKDGASAARALGVDASAIQACIRGKCKTAFTFQWRRALTDLDD